MPGQLNYAVAPAYATNAAAYPLDFTEFPVIAAVLLHIVTFGLFTIIYFNLMHDKMPKLRQDDPSAGKGVGFCFIPFFNWYWLFFTFTRLERRMEEQRVRVGGSRRPRRRETATGSGFPSPRVRR